MGLNEIKSQLRVDDDDHAHDRDLVPLISAAREWCEEHQNRAYITQTFELALDRCPNSNLIRLPRPQLQKIEHVKITSADGETVFWDESNYEADDFSEPGYMVKVAGAQWPNTRLRTNGLIIRYVAGYGSDSYCVPDRIKRAIIMLVLFWFENGICEPPSAVKNLLALDRVVPL